MILDTNAVSDLFEGNPGIRRLLGRSKASLPIIVLGEYRYGLLGSRRQALIEPKLDELQALSNVLNIDTGTVQPYAMLRDKLKRAGTPMPANDVWIAALALQHELPIASQDGHFDVMPGVRRIGW
jgi:tRNA(fMet)-specific endonuclease VapC